METIWPDSLPVEAMKEFLARQIASWTYLGESSVYNSSSENVLFTRNAGYVAVAGSEGTLIGFGCEGMEARVPGLHEETDVLDVGYGMNPIFAGQGHGLELPPNHGMSEV